MFCVSLCELYFLIFILGFEVIVYGSFVYYFEWSMFEFKFVNILVLFWWVLVIMIMVGYGDMYLIILFGKLVGCVCVISGVLMIVLFVFVVVSNFLLYNFYVKVKFKFFFCGKKNMVDNVFKVL